MVFASIKGIIGPYLFEGNDGQFVNVNSAVYKEQVINRFIADFHNYVLLPKWSVI